MSSYSDYFSNLRKEAEKQLDSAKHNPRETQDNIDILSKKISAKYAQDSDIQLLIQELNITKEQVKIQQSQLVETQYNLAVCQEQLAKLFDSSPVGYVVLDQNCVILQANQIACSMLNAEQAKIANQPLLQWIRQEDQTFFSENFLSFFQHPQDQQIQFRLAHQHNEFPTWVCITACLMENFIFGFPLVHGTVLLVALNDITSLKQLESNLMQFRVAIDNVAEAIFLIDVQTMLFVDCNETAIQMFGYSREELFNMRPQDLRVSSSSEQIRNQYHQLAYGNQNSMMMEATYRKKDGTILYGEVLLQRFTNQIKTYIIGSVRDISERKRAETALQQQNEKLDRFFEISLDLVCIGDDQGNILHVNPAWEKLLGYTPEELTSVPCFHFVHPDDLEITKESVRRLQEDSPQIDFVNRFIAKDGSCHWLEWRASRHQDKLVYAAARDITERIQYQQQIEQMVQEWHDTFDAMGHMILILDTHYNIVRYNKACQKIFSIGNVTQNKCFILLHHTSSPISQCFLEKVLATNQSMEDEIYEPFLQRYFRIRLDPIFDSHHQIKAVVHQIHDIHAQKLVEYNLRTLAQKAEAADAAKSQFLANMSHEIRTPLNGILGSIELLRETNLSIEQQEFVDTMQNSADLLLTVINDILDFSKIEAGRMSISNTPFDLANLIEESVASLWNHTRGKLVEIICIISSNVPVMMSGDPIRLKQILLNLIGNAIKFTQRGTILVTAELATQNTTISQAGILFPELIVELHHTYATTSPQSRIIFSVQDTGIGLQSEKISSLFMPFIQANSNYHHEHHGTGLGLVISKKLVAMMGGDIGVASIEGKGSNFAFTANLENIGSSTKFSDKIRELRGMVISANPYLLRSLNEILKSWKLNYSLISDMAEGIREIELSIQNNQSRQIVIVDANSCCDDLAQFVDTALANPVLAKVKLLVLIPLCDLHEALQMSVPDFIFWVPKPIQRKKLLTKMEQATASIITGFDTHKKMILSKTATRRLYDMESQLQTVHSQHSEVRILLAEDNYINQQVAVGILKSLGYHHIQVVSDGYAVLTALERNRYDILLLDIQMPGIDGYEATQKIRQTESAYSKIPIIAMTAHAMQEDYKKCLSVGMNGYIAKPISKQEVDSVITKVYFQHTNTYPLPGLMNTNDHASVLPTEETNEPLAFHYNDLLHRLGDDISIVQDALKIFIETMPNQLQILHQAIQEGNFGIIRQLSHSIQGAAGNVSALSLQQIALEIEIAAKNSSPILVSFASGKYTKLLDAFQKFKLTVQPILSKSQL